MIIVIVVGMHGKDGVQQCFWIGGYLWSPVLTWRHELVRAAHWGSDLIDLTAYFRYELLNGLLNVIKNEHHSGYQDITTSFSIY